MSYSNCTSTVVRTPYYFSTPKIDVLCKRTEPDVISVKRVSNIRWPNFRSVPRRLWILHLYCPSRRRQ